MDQEDKLDPRLAALLDDLKSAPMRDPQTAARARSRFLTQAISASEEQRHSLWTIFQQKEKFAMNIIVSTLVVLGLLFGGSATVSAAQDDLPTQPLYQVKLASEDLKVWFASDPIIKIDLLMNQVQTRTEEMSALTQAGVTPPVELADRTQDEIHQALQLALSLNEPERLAMLEQIQTQLQAQQQLMTQLQNGTCSACEPILQQTHDMFQNQLGQIEGDIASHNQNQNQIRATQTPLATDNPVTPQASHTPVMNGAGQQNGNNYSSTGTPMPQNGGGTQPHNGNGSTPASGGQGGGGGGSGGGGRP